MSVLPPLASRSVTRNVAYNIEGVTMHIIFHVSLYYVPFTFGGNSLVLSSFVMVCAMLLI